MACFDPDSMKIVLCKECKGLGVVEDVSEKLSSRGRTCSVCRGYGRLVRQLIKTELPLSEFDDLANSERSKDPADDPE